MCICIMMLAIALRVREEIEMPRTVRSNAEIYVSEHEMYVYYYR